jgi:NAD(P)-dependent dehydrogenase (short-subunit alcohol dehydrogenase family)
MTPMPAHEGCAVVTGGTRGIGAAVADRLRADGWPVAVLARSGGDVTADVADPAAVSAAFDAVESEHGPVLVLVNNAGQRRDGLAIRMSDEDWRAVLSTNLDGAFHCTRRALSGMLKARWGRIVNVSSVVALHANPGQANYAASKAGLLALTRTIAREMGKKGITCNAVTPGIVETDMTRDVVDDLVGMVPAGRAGTPQDVAAAVGFLCSEEAAYVNGATLAVDGALAA